MKPPLPLLGAIVEVFHPVRERRNAQRERLLPHRDEAGIRHCLTDTDPTEPTVPQGMDQFERSECIKIIPNALLHCSWGSPKTMLSSFKTPAQFKSFEERFRINPVLRTRCPRKGRSNITTVSQGPPDGFQCLLPNFQVSKYSRVIGLPSIRPHFQLPANRSSGTKGHTV